MSLTPPYSLLTRTSKGSQLTIDEMDGNLLYLASTLSGSNTITGSVNFTGSLVDFLQVGTVTGSFSGDGSGLTGVISASYAVSASHEIIKEISSSFADVAGGLTGQPSIHVTNITASGNISASGYYYGDGSQLTGISAGQWYDGTTYLSSSLSIKVDSHITASGNISASGNIEASGLISASGDIYTDGYIYVNNGYIYGNRAAFSSHVILHSIYGGAQTATNLAITPSAVNGGGMLLTGPVTASSHISASGNIEATGTGSFNYVTTPIIEGSGSTALLHIEGAISASGDLSIAGFPSVSASLASGGGFTPSLATDLPARNITASANISSSGTVIASGVNIDTTDTSASFDIGTGEQVIPVLGLVNASSSAIISQAHPSGRIGRTTEIIGDVNMDIGPAAYPIDGHHVFYHSGSRELWKSSGEWDLSALGYPRTVGNQIQYGDGNLIGTIEANKFNDYRLIVGENVTDIWGGAYLMGRQSGSTYGANTQYAGFFVSASLGLPGTPQGHDKAFTIYTGNQTGPAFNIYNADDPDNQSGTDPVFSIAANGALGNVTASNISSSGALYGNLLTPAQISITQVGMLTSLTVNGNTMLSGNVTQSGHISSSGDLIGDNLQVETRTMPIDHVPGGAGVRSGDIINLGNSTTVPGLIYALTGSSYEYVAAQSGSGALASSSLAVAIGTNSNTNGMLMRGFVNLGHDPGGPIGGPVYLTANGSASYSAPTATGDIVRVLGHNFGNNSIYFNPSNDWIVRS